MPIPGVDVNRVLLFVDNWRKMEMSNDKNVIDNKSKKKEKGASLIEYALLVALIAVVCITAITVVGGRASASFDNISDQL